MKTPHSPVTATLAYQPPYQWEQILGFLALRAIPGVECVRDGVYVRTMRVVSGAQQVFGWLRVCHSPETTSLVVTVNAALSPVLPYIVGRVGHLFDLQCAPNTVYACLAPMNSLRPGLCVAGIRVPGCVDPFEMAVRAVLGQQITVKAACTLAGRFAKAYGTPLETGIDGLEYAFPAPQDVIALAFRGGSIAEYLGPLGITRIRARAILALAESLVRGDIDCIQCPQPELEMQKLLALPGIGPWTATYIAMRAMGWSDAFLHSDYGVKKALRPFSAAEILRMAEAWRPWRSYAVVNLWNAL